MFTDYDVFLSHTGDQKRDIVDFLSRELRLNGLSVFVDYSELKPCDHAPSVMLQAAQRARVGVFVLSKRFLEKKWPVWELNIFLDRRNKDTKNSDQNIETVMIHPIFYDVWYGQTNRSGKVETNVFEDNLLSHVSEYTGMIHHPEAFGVQFVEANADAVLNVVAKVKFALEANKPSVDVDPRNIWNAAQTGDNDALIPWLIRKDLLNKPRRNETPLTIAAYWGHLNIVRLLIQAGADVDIPISGCEVTPLMLASLRNHATIVQFLIEQNANINKQSVAGWTALHLAAKNGHSVVVEHLLHHKADISLKTNNNLTAMDLAKGHANIIALLANNINENNL